jgi:hypothetical protein
LADRAPLFGVGSGLTGPGNLDRLTAVGSHSNGIRQCQERSRLCVNAGGGGQHEQAGQ